MVMVVAAALIVAVVIVVIGFYCMSCFIVEYLYHVA